MSYLPIRLPVFFHTEAILNGEPIELHQIGLDLDLSGFTIFGMAPRPNEKGDPESFANTGTILRMDGETALILAGAIAHALGHTLT